MDHNEIDMLKLPKHIAIIMDGNGRWASSRKLLRTFGHKAGSQKLREIAEYADSIGLEHMTVYAFSTENWQRSADEISYIMNLLRTYLKDYFEKSDTNNIKVDVIGDMSRLDLDIQDYINNLAEISKSKTGLKLHIAMNYGGRDEIVRSVKSIMKDFENGNVDYNNFDENTFSSYLDTKDIPDPELLIRTSNEIRISNFLLWQIAYSEMVFSEKLWPDFTIKDFDSAICEFQKRERRFGGRK